MLAIKLLDKASEIQPFLTHLILGLLESDLHEHIRNILLEWAKSKRELLMITGLFWYTKKADLKLIRIIFSSIKDDTRALNILASNIIVCYDDEKEIKDIFLDVIKVLTKRESTEWIHPS